MRQILHKKRYHYRTFELEKRDGSRRTISTPKTYLKVMQWWIADNVLSLADISNRVHGFRVGRSYITNARAHLGAAHILNVDIKRFFPSITEEMVASVFRGLGYGQEGAALLASLTTLEGAAPTGAPTSPSLGNIILAKFDEEMEAAASNRQFTYTRYADDLTFSGQDRIEEDFLKEVSDLIAQHGFVLNEKKTRFLGRGDRMDITGIVINAGANLPIEWRNRARGFLKRVTRNPADFLDDHLAVAGTLGLLKSVDEKEEKKLTQLAREALDAVKAARKS